MPRFRISSLASASVLALMFAAFTAATVQACVTQAQLVCVKNAAGTFGGNIVAQVGAYHAPAGSTGLVSYEVVALAGFVKDGQSVAAGTVIGQPQMDKVFTPSTSKSTSTSAFGLSTSEPYDSDVSGPAQVVIIKMTVTNEHGKVVHDQESPQSFAGNLSDCANAAPPVTTVTPPAPAPTPVATPTPAPAPAPTPVTPKAPKPVPPVLTLHKSVTSLTAGQTGSYTIVGTVTGNSTKNVWVHDRLPAGLTLVSLPKGATLHGDVIYWNTGFIAKGSSFTLTIQVKLDVNVLPHNLCNTAGARINGGKATSSNTACTMTIPRKTPPRAGGPTG